VPLPHGSGSRLRVRDGDYYTTHKTPEQLLADFFKIDLDKVENERRALLERVQEDAGK
jgi:hypothetical protein